MTVVVSEGPCNVLSSHGWTNILLWMLWFNFMLGLNFIFLCFKLIIIHYHTPKQREIKFKPRIKLNHNIATSLLYFGGVHRELTSYTHVTKMTIVCLFICLFREAQPQAVVDTCQGPQQVQILVIIIKNY